MPNLLNWQVLSDSAHLDELIAQSRHHPQLIFKHSTRCSVSDLALNRLKTAEADLAPYATLHYLDLIAHRAVSDEVAQRFGVVHESPQVLLVFAGECVLEQSHLGVQAGELIDVLRTLTPSQPE